MADSRHLKNQHTHTRLTALFPGLPGWAGNRKVKAIWILLKQETVSGSGISWAICKSASRSRQITMPALHHSKFFYRPDALPAAQPTASKHWRQNNEWINEWVFNEYCIQRINKSHTSCHHYEADTRMIQLYTFCLPCCFITFLHLVLCSRLSQLSWLRLSVSIVRFSVTKQISHHIIHCCMLSQIKHLQTSTIS